MSTEQESKRMTTCKTAEALDYVVAWPLSHRRTENSRSASDRDARSKNGVTRGYPIGRNMKTSLVVPFWLLSLSIDPEQRVDDGIRNQAGN